jgi:hypothetical protein
MANLPRSPHGARLALCRTARESCLPRLGIKLFKYGRLLELSFLGQQQAFSLLSDPRHFGGLQWYAICFRAGRRVRALFRPLGASVFASRHYWGEGLGMPRSFSTRFGGPGERKQWSKQLYSETRARMSGICRPSRKGSAGRPMSGGWLAMMPLRGCSTRSSS